MRLEDHVAALASMGDEQPDDSALAAATRLRIRGSLERGHVWRRHASVLAALAIMLVASGAWALATGRLQRWVAPPHATLPAPRAVSMPPAPALAHTQAGVPSPAVEPAPVVATSPVVTPAQTPAHAVATAPVVTPAQTPAPTAAHVARATSARPVAIAEVAPDPADALYTRAHELHFRGGAPGDALAAWDAYLAAAPNGQLAIEARYNRALCLVRLGRLADARTALAPFAHGTVQPAGYRQSDAAQLIERIDRRLNGTR